MGPKSKGKWRQGERLSQGEKQRRDNRKRDKERRGILKDTLDKLATSKFFQELSYSMYKYSCQIGDIYEEV